MTKPPIERVALLCGGVGGAKLAYGLYHTLNHDQLTIIGNTGDDFVHFGLHISPDLDTIMYTLTDLVNPDTGWGRADESWLAMETAKSIGAPDWFNLGDRDLGVHLGRTHFLHQGETISSATATLCHSLRLGVRLLPMSDQLAPTLIRTPDGIQSFQEWFVKNRWQPRVEAVELPENTMATPAVMQAIEQADIVIIAPSNPYVSIDPILNCYPIRTMLEDSAKTVIVVSPLVGDDAVKGPTAKMMREWELPVSAQTVANFYSDLATIFIQDERDKSAVSYEKMRIMKTDTLMKTLDDRIRLASVVLQCVRDEIARQ